MGARSSAPVQTGSGAHPASCTMGTGSFPRVKSGWGMTLTPHPLLVPWSRKGRAIPLLHLWVIRPVQSLSAYTRAHFTFTLLLPVMFRLFYMSIVQVIDMKVNPLVYTDVLNMPCHIFCLLRREVHTHI